MHITAAQLVDSILLSSQFHSNPNDVNRVQLHQRQREITYGQIDVNYALANNILFSFRFGLLANGEWRTVRCGISVCLWLLSMQMQNLISP